MKLPLLFMLVGVIISGCGGEKWLLADQATSTAAVRNEVRLEQICAPDAGTCDPAMVRALARTPLCGNASMLAHHGDPLPDLGGITCSPK